MRDAKPLASPPDAAAKARAKTAGKTLADIDSRRLVFVDGTFAPELSHLDGLEPGMSIRPMAEALAAGDALVTKHLGKTVPVQDDIAVALNTAFMGDGAVIRVAANATVERPLHLVFAAAGDKPASMFTRSLVVVEAGAPALGGGSHRGTRGYQPNQPVRVVLREGGPVG